MLVPSTCPQQQRTVYRLTLVKAWNVDELKAYSDLIALGQPDFIEVKVCQPSSALCPLHLDLRFNSCFKCTHINSAM